MAIPFVLVGAGVRRLRQRRRALRWIERNATIQSSLDDVHTMHDLHTVNDLDLHELHDLASVTMLAAGLQREPSLELVKRSTRSSVERRAGTIEVGMADMIDGLADDDVGDAERSLAVHKAELQRLMRIQAMRQDEIDAIK